MGAEATGTCLITFTGTATGSSGTLTANATKRTAKTLTITVGGTIIATCTVAAAADIQFEEVSGRANQNPSEYCSVGVLSAPFHGAGVDGIRYFGHENGNSVASNVVTEATGAAINEATTGITQGYLAEGQRQNLCKWSEVFDNASWTKTDTTPTANNIASPDGRTTAELMTEGVAGTALASQGITITSNASIAWSVFLKKGNNNIHRITAYETATAANAITGWFNLNTGVVGSVANGGTGTLAAVSIEAFANGWYRCTLTGKVNNAATAITIAMSSASADASTTRVNNATYYAWGAQVEDNVALPSSYIPTTTAAVTRNADVLTYVLAGNADNTKGTCYAEARSSQSGSTFTFTSGIVFLTDTNGRALYFANTTATTATSVYDGTAPITKTGLDNATAAAVKRISAWQGSTMSITGNGAAVASGAFDGTMGAGTGNIAIGGISGAELYGVLRNVRLYNVALSSAQLVSLTT